MTDPAMPQKTAFLADEGNRWYERNRVALQTPSPLRDRIVSRLAEQLTRGVQHRVLEVGSGTGQHAVHFAPALPHLSWQTSERAEALPGLRL